MSLQEIVAMFLYTLAHHKKNRSIGQYFFRSGETVSRQFHLCLRAFLKLHEVLLYNPTPISDDCEDERWKSFKNCLGALDGTYINVNVPSQERPKYRTRKGTIAMNVLGVCAPNMQFIYVLPGWEGSAHDMRVLRNALSRPNGFRVPRGCDFRSVCFGFLTQKKAKGLYGVPFVHYETLAEIYAKDKATGDVSESFVDAIKGIDQEIDKQPLIVESDEEDDVNSANSDTYSSTSQSGKRPSLCRNDDDDLVASLHDVSNNFGKIFENINVNLGTMTSAWSKAEEREQRMDEKVNKVLDEVMKLDGISPSEALEVATILMAEEHKLRIFYQAPFNMKKQYAIDLLKKK
uniref:DDE Tnp4 domain-containing protein n=1 Tax=Chenopodium quinoa TaxID=63459 RepID=A0A803KR82_CHEQI